MDGFGHRRTRAACSVKSPTSRPSTASARRPLADRPSPSCTATARATFGQPATGADSIALSLRRPISSATTPKEPSSIIRLSASLKRTTKELSGSARRLASYASVLHVTSMTCKYATTATPTTSCSSNSRPRLMATTTSCSEYAAAYGGSLLTSCRPSASSNPFTS